jgi:hypothetical protein
LFKGEVPEKIANGNRGTSTSRKQARPAAIADGCDVLPSVTDQRSCEFKIKRAYAGEA